MRSYRYDAGDFALFHCGHFVFSLRTADQGESSGIFSLVNFGVACEVSTGRRQPDSHASPLRKRNLARVAGAVHFH
jgi:hypothetical protein